MKLNLLDKWLLVVAICFLAVSCQQLSDELQAVQEKGTLRVKTRSAVNETIIYPIHLYAFSSDADCIVSQIVEDEAESVQLSLPAGKYRVVAIAGISDDYEIPSDPNLEDEIKLLGEKGAETPLMLGKADVTVGADKESKLELALSYSVASIDVALSQVPSEVESIQVTLSSFYSSMDMNGEYVDSDYSLTLDCSLDTENQWSSQTRYVFPGNGSQVTLSISMKLKDGEELTYGYVWKDVPQSNQPYRLQGEYTNGYSLNGTFTVLGWNEAKEIEFTFGDNISSDEEEDTEGEENPDVDLSGLPEIGSIWNGTIMADIIEADESGADVLLLSLDEWDATVSQVDDVILGYTINGISDWRLPTHEEAATLRSKFSGDARVELNERIAEYDSELYGLANGDKERYLCLKDGKLYSFQFIAGTGTTVAGEKRSYYVRLVKSYHIDF